MVSYLLMKGRSDRKSHIGYKILRGVSWRLSLSVFLLLNSWIDVKDQNSIETTFWSTNHRNFYV
ncbi:hypothetical protein HKD37_04G010019 [Glycine soja]